jgi:hypothetical protein
MKYVSAALLFSVLSCLISSCFSTPSSPSRPETAKQETMVYMFIHETDDYKDYESIAIAKDSYMVSYTITIDRITPTKQILITLEMGRYTISGDGIEIITDKSHFNGTLLDDKILINEKEYVLSKQR